MYYGCPTGQVRKSEIPKHAGTVDKSISTGIKYWVCCIRALFDLQFVHNLFWLKLNWNVRSKLFYCVIYRSFMLWWSSRTLTKLKSQSQKRFNERKYQYKNKNHSGTDTSKLSDINLVPNLNFCAKYDRGLDLGFWELLKPLKWTNITSFFLIWLKRSTKIFISLWI